MEESPFPDGSVLLVAEPLNPGGISVYTRSIMTGLTAKEIPHPLLTSTRPAPELFPPEELENMRVVGGLFWSNWRPFMFRRITAWARAQQPSLIHGLSALTAPICNKLAEALEIPYLVTVHHFQKPGVLRPEKRCAGMIAVSESLRENLVNDAHIPKEIVRLIPAGIKVPRELQTRVLETAPDAKTAAPLISSFGKLVPRKDFQTFLKAARLISDRLENKCSFIIAGEGPEESALRKMAREMKLDKQVTFCHGNVPYGVLLHDTDVYVQCSKVEGFGTMVLQAMAHGVPVVATSTGGILSLIKEGESGYLVSVGDAESIANRVVQILTDPALARRLSDVARRNAADNYDLDNMMSSTLELYQQAIALKLEV